MNANIRSGFVVAANLLLLAGCVQAPPAEQATGPKPSIPYIPPELAFPDNSQAIHKLQDTVCNTMIQDYNAHRSTFMTKECVAMMGKGDVGKGSANNDEFYNQFLRYGSKGPAHDPAVTLRPMDPPPRGHDYATQRALNDCSVQQQAHILLSATCSGLVDESGNRPFGNMPVQLPAAEQPIGSPAMPTDPSADPNKALARLCLEQGWSGQPVSPWCHSLNGADGQPAEPIRSPSPAEGSIECLLPNREIITMPSRQACRQMHGNIFD